MVVVFTGPATDAKDRPILRADLVATAKQAGHTVLDQIGPGVQLLVASRLDTVKARKAAHMGIEVISYPDYLKILPKPLLASQSRSKPCPYTDTHVAPQMPKRGTWVEQF